MVSAAPLDFEAATALLSASSIAQTRPNIYRYMANMDEANNVQFQQVFDPGFTFVQPEDGMSSWNNEFTFDPSPDQADYYSFPTFTGQLTQSHLLPPQPQLPADYTNFEAQQFQQQDLLPPPAAAAVVATPPGFRPLDEPHTVKHERVDSIGSNGGAGTKVAIPKNGSISSLKRKTSEELSPTAGADAGMTAVRSGPMSADFQVPARPRPGRKPLGQENAQDRRRVQNRVAQRNFRDKRAQKNQQLEDEISALRTAHQQQEARYRNTVAGLQAQCAEKDKVLAELKAEIASLRSEITEKDRRITDLDTSLKAKLSVEQYRPPTGQAPFHEPSTGPTPPSSEYEMDFTNYGRTTNNEDPCGFCTDEQNCACKQEQQRQRPKPAPVEPRVGVTLPGSCDMCQSDPERARACREMAAATRPAGSETPRLPGVNVLAKDSTDSKSMPPPRMSCSAMLDQFNKYGQRTSTIRDLFGGLPLTAYPRENGGGYDFEEKQAAEVLSTLARRSTGAESNSSFAESQ